MDACVSLLMAIHCHQPVGNFGFVFAEAFRKAYEPFVSALERHPAIHVALHYSGSLLEWLGEHQGNFLDRLRQLARRNQVEFLASGYYEPILPTIPEVDQEGQIGLMQRAIGRRFGVKPSGLWLTERVWEPELPSMLARCGIRYTILDTNQFRVAKSVLPSHLQVQDDQGWDLLGCYMTEHAGDSVVVFPASKRLRYWIPFQEVWRTIEFLKRLVREEPVAITFADDGEKFGLWPKTYGWVYEQGWLEQFFSALERESSWLVTSTFSRYLNEIGPEGKVYLPCGSYEEMLDWSGGYFRHFFVKYPEANAMHHKMLYVSQQLQQVQSSKPSKSTGRKSPQSAIRNSPLIKRARQELYMAQCNDAYWHGVFGGLYLANLRRAVYRHLIEAERLIQQVQGPLPVQELQDLDGDGRAEVILRTPTLSVVVDPDEGGTVTELDCYPKAINLVDTLSRRYEPYHEKLKAKHSSAVASASQVPTSIHDLLEPKEEGLEAHLAYDDHRRSCFIDYALAAMPTLQEVWRSTWGEHRLWSGGPWDLAPNPTRPSADRTTVTLSRRVQGGGLRKTITVFRNQLRLGFDYQLIDLKVPVVGLEFNLGLRDEQRPKPQWQEAVREVQVLDPSLGLAVSMAIDPPASVVSFPIETISESEEGLERTPQGVAIVCLWPTRELRRWSCGIQWSITDLSCHPCAEQ